MSKQVLQLGGAKPGELLRAQVKYKTVQGETNGPLKLLRGMLVASRCCPFWGVSDLDNLMASSLLKVGSQCETPRAKPWWVQKQKRWGNKTFGRVKSELHQ